jgi:hypothetical protein
MFEDVTEYIFWFGSDNCLNLGYSFRRNMGKGNTTSCEVGSE